MNNRDYQRNLFNARLSTNGNMDAVSKEMVKVLQRAYRDIVEIMQLEGPNKISYSVWASRKAAIVEVVDAMTTQLNIKTRLGMRSAAQDTIDLYKALNQSMVKKTGFKYDFTRAYSTVPLQAVRNVTARLWGDKQTFSDRIWRTNRYAKTSVERIVTAGIARGESAVDMSKQLRDFLIEPTITPETSWTTGITKSVTGNGTIHFNALRLARTEINNAYREALVIANDKNPIMLGVKWNLSAKHAVPDVCDLWAKLDQFGYGPGGYPAAKTPIDHPNGFCFLTELIRKPQEWGSERPAPDEVDFTKEEALSVVGAGSLTEGQRTAAFKMFNNTRSLLNSNRMAKAA